MGFELPEVCSDNETPFSLPEPINVDNHNHVTVTSPPPAQEPPPSLDHTDDVTDGSPREPPQAVPSSHGVPSTTMTSSVKVRPFEDPDDEVDSGQVLGKPGIYSPSDETPIQREIRLANEREQLLRKDRGLPPKSGGSPSRPLSSNRRSLTETDHVEDLSGNEITSGRRISMRQFASSRLALELERERERELDLRRLGVINTISEERSLAVSNGCHDDGDGCHVNGHVTAGDADKPGGTWLIEREVRDAEQRELELQMQRARLSGAYSDVTSSPDDSQ